jgi:hypothetical protein
MARALRRSCRSRTRRRSIVQRRPFSRESAVHAPRTLGSGDPADLVVLGRQGAACHRPPAGNGRRRVVRGSARVDGADRQRAGATAAAAVRRSWCAAHRSDGPMTDLAIAIRRDRIGAARLAGRAGRHARLQQGRGHGGGVDTRELSSKTMAANRVPACYFIGEVVDVTGWLGGYNFQWGVVVGSRRRGACLMAKLHGDRRNDRAPRRCRGNSARRGARRAFGGAKLLARVRMNAGVEGVAHDRAPAPLRATAWASWLPEPDRGAAAGRGGRTPDDAVLARRSARRGPVSSLRECRIRNGSEPRVRRARDPGRRRLGRRAGRHAVDPIVHDRVRRAAIADGAPVAAPFHRGQRGHPWALAPPASPRCRR